MGIAVGGFVGDAVGSTVGLDGHVPQATGQALCAAGSLHLGRTLFPAQVLVFILPLNVPIVTLYLSSMSLQQELQVRGH